MAFRWLLAFLNNCISTNVYGRFESLRFFNQETTLVAGLVKGDWRSSFETFLTNRPGIPNRRFPVGGAPQGISVVQSVENSLGGTSPPIQLIRDFGDATAHEPPPFPWKLGVGSWELAFMALIHVYSLC